MTVEVAQDIEVSENAESPRQTITDVSENAESLGRVVYEVASTLFRSNADWGMFHREVFGSEGILRRWLPTREQRAAFQRTETYAEIQRMLCQLRRRANDTPSREGRTVVVMIRVPRSLRDVLRAEAHELHTSLNKLCISKLLQMCEDESRPLRPFGEVLENADSLCQVIYEVASTLFRNNADWRTFHRKVFGIKGIVRRCFRTREQLAAFERTETYAEIQGMLRQLRCRATGSPPREKLVGAMTIRVPQSVQEVLRTEADEQGTSVNQLCISKLLQAIDEELVPSNLEEEEDEEDPWNLMITTAEEQRVA